MATLSALITNFVAGDPLPLGQRGVTNLATTISGASFAVYPLADHTVGALFSSGGAGGSSIAVTNSGVLQTDGTYTAQVQPTISAADSALLDGLTGWLYITITQSDGKSFHSEIVPLQPIG